MHIYTKDLAHIILNPPKTDKDLISDRIPEDARRDFTVTFHKRFVTFAFA